MPVFYTQAELLAVKSGVFIFDVESFVNYWLVAFKNIEDGKIAYFESKNNEPIQSDWLQWMVDNFCLVGFNCKAYDLPVISMAITGRYTIADLKEATRLLIDDSLPVKELCERYDFSIVNCNSVDLFDVAPLTGSLKTYAARLHCPHLQELPYDPTTTLTCEQIAAVRSYCVNGDLPNTLLLLRELEKHLELRAALSVEFGKDLRSKSDAQLAQEIVNIEIARITGKSPKRVNFKTLVGSMFCYKPPSYVRFVNPEYNAIVAEIAAAEIEIGESGHVICPKSIEGRSFLIAEKKYAIGMGGLHSKEKVQSLITGDLRILDRDVTGYYPNLILKNGFAPEHLGQAFLDTLQSIVDKRYSAKKAGRQVEADSLKIATNGTFGKLSDPYSTIYSPAAMVQTTLTGQLSLLMQIEALELNGFPVMSANTDGVVALCATERYEQFKTLWANWERITNLETEETEYKALYARDVNNYIAIDVKGKVKQKGCYSYVGSALNSPLSKNPDMQICIDAVIARIVNGVPLMQTIAACKDIRRFLIVEKVTGGAQKDGKYLGKTVRWYYAKNVLGCIIKCKNGNKVPKSDNARPCMILPSYFPDDVDYARYEEESLRILEGVGFQKKRLEQLTMV